MFDTHATNLDRTSRHEELRDATGEGNLCLLETGGWSEVANHLSFPEETLPKVNPLRESHAEPTLHPSKQARVNLSRLWCALALVLLALSYPAVMLWQGAPHGIHSLIRVGTSLGAIVLIVLAGWIASLFIQE